MTYYLPDSVGWGNVALCISDLVHRSPRPRVFKNLNDVDRGVEFSGFEVTDDPNEERFEPRCIVNPQYYHLVHSNLIQIIKPNKDLEELIKKYEHGLTHGIHIRRGACSKDSAEIGCHGLDENGDIKPAYFAKDSALNKFVEIVQNTDAKFFLASDSQEIKKMFKERFPDKIVTLDHEIALTYDCDFLKNHGISKEVRYAAYLDWFLLTKCRELYITAGNQDMSDLSTFGYSAGAYGRCNIHFVFN
jgi:hypothetical protein